MWRFIQRINHRNAVMANLNALLLMYPRKRQFIHDFPKLKATLREHFEEEAPPASSALIVATSIIDGFLQQLSAEEKRATAAALAACDPTEIEKLAERRIGGEKDQAGDKVFFATRLSGVAIFMAGKMVGVNALQGEEYRKLVGAVERGLGVTSSLDLATRFRLPAG